MAHIEAHMVAEQRILESYEDLSAAGPGHVRYLVGLIADDERRHHRILGEIANRLASDPESEPVEPSVPTEAYEPGDADRLLRETNRFLDLERSDLYELHLLQRAMRRQPGNGLFPLLVRIMELDTAKHIAMMRSIPPACFARHSRSRAEGPNATPSGLGAGPVRRLIDGYRAPSPGEFVMVQSELYTGPEGQPGDRAKMIGNDFDAVVFNGYVNQYQHAPLKVQPNERIRVWVLDAGPSENSAFHIVGTKFDTVFKEGAYLLRPGNAEQDGSQTLDLQPSQGGFVEFTFRDPGLYAMVTHKFSNVGMGALGVFQAGDVATDGTGH